MCVPRTKCAHGNVSKGMECPCQLPLLAMPEAGLLSLLVLLFMQASTIRQRGCLETSVTANQTCFYWQRTGRHLVGLWWKTCVYGFSLTRSVDWASGFTRILPARVHTVLSGNSGLFLCGGHPLSTRSYECGNICCHHCWETARCISKGREKRTSLTPLTKNWGT